MNAPMTYQEQCSSIIGLFEANNVSIKQDAVKNWIACTEFDVVLAYFESIGVLISHNQLGISFSVSTVSNDAQWAVRKLETLRNHLNLA